MYLMNENIKMSSLRAVKTFKRKRIGETYLFQIINLCSDPERTVNESQRKHTVISSFNKAVNPKTDINKKGPL